MSPMVRLVLQENVADSGLTVRGFVRSVIRASGIVMAFSFLSYASLSYAAPVDSDTTAASEDTALPEVVVTAEFRKERVQETPLAVTALTGAMLTEKGVTDLVGAGNLAPNVTLTQGSSQGAFGQMASVFIRGVGQSDPHFAVEPGVGIYIDDVYYGVMPGAMFKLLDTDRVEVLRGPQGTLSGKNSIGGSIKLFSIEPGPEDNAYAEVEYGSFKEVGGRAASNFTLEEGTLFARVSVGAVRSDGYMTRLDYACVAGIAPTNRINSSCALGTQGGQDSVSGRASLRWLPAEGIDDLLSVDTISDNSENPAVKQLQTAPQWAGTNNYVTCATCYTNYENYISKVVSGPSAGSTFQMPSTTPLNGWGASNNLHVKLADNLSLDSITAVRQSAVTFVVTAEATPASLTDQVWREWHSQITQEARLNGAVSHWVEWTLGGYYYDAHGTSGGRVNIPFGLQLGGGDAGIGIADDILFQDPVESVNKSEFLHTISHVTDKLGLTLDGRHSTDTKDFTFNRYNSLGEPNPALPGLLGLRVNYSGSRWDYRAGVNYDWTPDIMSYAQVSTGYKGGGVNPRPFYPSQAITYNPEQLTAYEVGLKSAFLDSRWIVNVAAFHDQYSDFQGSLTSCDAYSPFPGAPCDMTANVGNAHIDGAEVESTLRVVGGLTIDASVGWLDFKYTKVDPNTGVSLNDTNVFTPKWTGNLGIQYAIGLGNAGTLTPRVDGSYRDTVYTSFVNYISNRLPSQALLNAQLSWSDSRSKWAATLEVKNLTDKYYFLGVGGNPPPPQVSLTPGAVAEVAPPREFVFTIRRNLGG